MKRILVPEMMDQPSADPALLAESLDDLAWMNRYLGVTAGILHQIGKLLNGQLPGRISVLDVGAGGGDVLGALGHWCRRRGVRLDGVAVDSGQTTVRLAAARLAESTAAEGAGVVCGDALALPFGDRRFDIAIGCTFLHHLEADEAVAALTEMARVSERGVVVTDLRRSVAAFLGASALASTVWRRHRYPRHDAPASVRAAYTLSEARMLARRAGLEAVVEPQPLFRWALRWRRG
jgi:2-polyprenyl-3-methyl-5-hydroxy-6-metoxy-1,4-benzoquinol methylase